MNEEEIIVGNWELSRSDDGKSWGAYSMLSAKENPSVGDFFDLIGGFIDFVKTEVQKHSNLTNIRWEIEYGEEPRDR